MIVIARVFLFSLAPPARAGVPFGGEAITTQFEIASGKSKNALAMTENSGLYGREF